MNSLVEKYPQVQDTRIILVDNDPAVRKRMVEHLRQQGFQVFTCADTDTAKKKIKQEDFDLLVTEMHLPNESGIELIRWVRRIFDTSYRRFMPLPCVMITGFAHIFETQDLSDLHLAECLIKPLDESELTEAILVALGIKEPESDERDKVEDLKCNFKPHTREYCKILLSDMHNQPNLVLDIYVQLSSEKFVRIAKRGDKLNEIQFHRFMDKGIQFLYVKKDDFRDILALNMKLSKAVTAANNIELIKKQKFLTKTGELILENAFVNGINQETFDNAKEYLCNSIATLIQQDDTFDLLQVLNDHNNSLYAHSLGVSIYSVMIAQKMGWSSGTNLFKLSFGALMHDIGKKDFDPELIEKPKSNLTFAEKELLETHPDRGREVLSSLKAVPSEVLAIAHEHHENHIGQGYPRRLKSSRISPMARIVNVADEFCYFAIKNPDYPDADASKAIYMLNQYKENLLDPDALAALRMVVEESKKMKKGA